MNHHNAANNFRMVARRLENDGGIVEQIESGEWDREGLTPVQKHELAVLLEDGFEYLRRLRVSLDKVRVHHLDLPGGDGVAGFVPTRRTLPPAVDAGRIAGDAVNARVMTPEQAAEAYRHWEDQGSATGDAFVSGYHTTGAASW